MSTPIWRRAVVVVSVAALVRLIFAAIIPLFPDEAYYWDWSRRLAPGYFDHPGGIAALVKLGAVFGATNVGVRFGAIVAGWIAAMATIAIARRIDGDMAAFRAAVIITVLPLAAAGLILATPDSPLLAATAVGLYFAARALESPLNSRASLGWWCATGIALGLAFSSKYTSIFLPVGVVLAILVRPELRARLREPGPYVACAIATLVFAPVLVWNAHHDWISFTFQLKHGLAKPEGSALRAAWRHEGDFFGGQAGLASPILFIMLGIATWRAFRARDVRFVLAVVAAVSFGFFVYSALRQRVEPNWPAPAYIPAIVLLAVTPWGRAGKKWLNAGIIFAGAMSLIIYVQGIVPVLPIPPAKDPIGRAFGWSETVHLADSMASASSLNTHSRTWLGGDRYQEAAELAFQSPAHPSTFATNLGGRPNQYDLWPGFATAAAVGENLVLVLDDSPETERPAAIDSLAPHFASADRGPIAPLMRGAGQIGIRRIWTLVGWRGTWPVVR